MKKLITALLLLGSIFVHGQGVPGGASDALSPDGVLEAVFDQYGNKYSLSDITIGKDPRDSKGELLRSTNTTPMTCGYFNLYFESGCGMDNPADATQLARRAVVCQVFSDLSAFINSPLTASGKKVNIWIRNINNLYSSANGILGLATSFYNIPNNATAGFGGIADNEVWKTIHTGVDSYTNVASPLASTGVGSGPSGIFYHGMMAFNFNTNNTPAINWNTNLSITTPAGLYDLYTVLLHEVTHALGFTSLINENGASKFGSGYNYFSRYDRFLKDNANTQFLLSNGTACSSMYNYSFNTALSNTILRPGCTSLGNINTGAPTNNTACSNAIRYVSASANVPVYTPVCFEPASSLSHFEDMIYPTCRSPYGNDAYFTMSNALATGVTKRYLKPEERIVLCDLGYNVKPTFGVSTTASGTFNYGGTACGGIAVAGINDGINANGTFTYLANSGTNITISGILSNDTSATGYECLQDVFSPGTTLSPTSGTTSSSITFNSTVTGLHLLRYVPTNGTQKGNITYIYVMVNRVNNCGNTTACNLVINGNFEQFSTLPTDIGQIDRACGWFATASGSSPDYHHTPGGNLEGVPCNFRGYEPDNLGLNGYAGMYINPGTTPNNFGSEIVATKLASALLPNKTYQLSFDVSLADYTSSNNIRFQAYLSNAASPIYTVGTYEIPIADPSMFFEYPSFSSVSSGWQRVYFNVTTGATAGQQYLYIGGLNTVHFQSATPAPTVPVCSGSNIGPSYTYYYLDNVNLVELAQAAFTLPGSVCQTQQFPNLRDFLSPAPVGGTFSGDGVSLSAGIYSFNATVAGLGNHIIRYTYTTNLGCQVSIYSNITVSNCSASSCPGSLVFNTTEPSANATYQAAASITTITNYLVNAGSTITLKAGNSITFSPSSEVKANSSSNFTAKIESCTQTSAKAAPDQSLATDYREMELYPNPTDDFTTIQLKNEEFKRVAITTIEGRTILNEALKPTSEYQYNTAHLTSGIYIVSIETKTGEIISKKLIKK